MNATQANDTFSRRMLKSVHVQFWIGTFLGALLVPLVEGGVSLVVANRSEAIKHQVQLLIQYINDLYKSPPTTVASAVNVVSYFEAHQTGTKSYMRPDGFDEAFAYAKSTLAELQARERVKQAGEAKAAAIEQARKAQEMKEDEDRKRLAHEAATKAAEAERQRVEAQRAADAFAAEVQNARDFARRSWRYN